MQKLIRFFALINIYLGVFFLASPIILGATVLLLDWGSRENLETVDLQVATENQTDENVHNVEVENEILTAALTNYHQDTVEEKSNFTVDTEIKNYGNKLRIPTIGVDTYIWESTNGKEALNNGVWRQYEHGVPGSDAPVVLAAHRWGDRELTREFRDANMFFHLPQITPGDSVNIFWNGMTYEYEVTKQYISQNVSEIADLVLITCKDLGAKNQVIVLAELENINFS